MMPWLFLVLTLVYFFFFYESVSEYWFNPLYTTDDALQQLFPLYEAIYPGIFVDDIVTESMRLYLAPLHYWMSMWLTKLFGDPNLAGHALHVVQLFLSLLFLFLLVRKLSNISGALFSVFWFLHTRNLVQRMTCGLPRGWAGFVITAFLYFLVSKNQWGVFTVLLVGALLHPPSTFLCAFCYGLWLAFGVARTYWRARSEESLTPQYVASKRLFIRYCIFAPLLIGVAYYSVQRPPEIGRMATYAEAEKLSGFHRRGGRFPFVPLKDPKIEINSVGMQAFINRWHKPAPWIRTNMVWMVSATFLSLILIGLYQRREIIPKEITLYLISVLSVYFLSRAFAFRLYVPDRHLQFPLNIFHIVAFTVGVWRLGAYWPKWKNKDEVSDCAPSRYRGELLLLLLAGLIFYLGRSGLEGTANFNTLTNQKEGLYSFIRNETPRSSTIAGHPDRIDGVQLFGIRKGYITTETAHPFYDAYYREVLRRLQVTFRGYFARSEEELLEQLGDEKIDYFVYFDYDFTPERLEKGSYHNPYKIWYRRLTQRAPRADLLAAKVLAVEPDKHISPDAHPYVVYRDAEAAVIDVAKLRSHVANRSRSTVNSSSEGSNPESGSIEPQKVERKN